MIDYGYGIALMALDPDNQDKRRDWRNDLAIRRWCRQVGLISSAQQESWEQFPPDNSSMFEIHSPASMVGTCGLTSIDFINRRAEFSLYIGPENQTRGYARAALLTLFRHGFEDLNLNRIWGESFTGNPAMKLFEKIGMEKEGVRREFYYKSGSYVDAHLYSISADHFACLHTKTATIS